MTASLALVLLVLPALPGCDACDSARPVPFKRQSGADAKEEKEVGERAAEDTGPATAAELPDGTARVHDGGPTLLLGERRVALPGAYASLELDLNADGRDDALVWAGEREGAPLALWLVRSDEEAELGAPQQVSRSSFSIPEGCTLKNAAFERLGADKAAVLSQLECEPREPPVPERHLLLLALGDSPRVLERVALRGTEAKGGLSFAGLTGSDQDGDGHTDLQLALDTHGPAGVLHITWLDRPSGLAREPNEPENTLGALASTAQKQLDEDPAAAARTAEATLSLYAQLCRESGQATLQVAGVWGLRCGRSGGAGRASLVRVQALAEEGQVVAALRALEALDPRALSIDPNAREQVVQTLAEKATTPAWKLIPMPEVSLPPAQPAQPPSVRIEDGGLWVGTRPPRMWQIRTRQELPVLHVPDLPRSFTDPSGRYHVRHLDRDCRGRLLRIAGPDDSAAHVRVVEHPEIPGCQLRLPVPDAGDMRVLGWAPQGVVLSDTQGALLVPLDAEARPTDAPRRVEPEVPLPAPLPAGRAAPSGRCHVRPTPQGVLVSEHGRDAQPRLVRPEGWESVQGVAREAVVDESCKRLAIATPSRVYLIEHDSAPPAPPIPTPALVPSPLSPTQLGPPAPGPPAAPSPAGDP